MGWTGNAVFIDGTSRVSESRLAARVLGTAPGEPEETTLDEALHDPGVAIGVYAGKTILAGDDVDDLVLDEAKLEAVLKAMGLQRAAAFSLVSGVCYFRYAVHESGRRVCERCGDADDDNEGSWDDLKPFELEFFGGSVRERDEMGRPVHGDDVHHEYGESLAFRAAGLVLGADFDEMDDEFFDTAMRRYEPAPAPPPAPPKPGWTLSFTTLYWIAGLTVGVSLLFVKACL